MKLEEKVKDKWKAVQDVSGNDKPGKEKSSINTEGKDPDLCHQ